MKLLAIHCHLFGANLRWTAWFAIPNQSVHPKKNSRNSSMYSQVIFSSDKLILEIFLTNLQGDDFMFSACQCYDCGYNSTFKVTHGNRKGDAWKNGTFSYKKIWVYWILYFFTAPSIRICQNFFLQSQFYPVNPTLLLDIMDKNGLLNQLKGFFMHLNRHFHSVLHIEEDLGVFFIVCRFVLPSLTINVCIMLYVYTLEY